MKYYRKRQPKCVVTTCIIALLGLSNHRDRNVQCLLLTARPGWQPLSKNMPANSLVPKHLQKNKNSIIRNLCTTSALLYLSPMTQSIHVKSSSFSNSTNFSGNQPSEFYLREKEMSDSGNSGRCVHWRGLCSLQTVELHPSANCLLFVLYITGTHKQVKHKTTPRESKGQLSLLSTCPENYVMSRLAVSSYMFKFSSLMWSTSETQQVLALTCRELEWT